jgi:hypothetical protein
MRRVQYLILSIVSHLFLLLMLMGYYLPKVDDMQQAAESGHGGEQESVSVEIVSIDDVYGETPCDNWYGGIGIVQDILGTITQVAPGYPAYRAGLKVGDVIFSYGNGPIRGEIGTEVIVIIVRNQETMTLTLVREKICVE